MVLVRYNPFVTRICVIPKATNIGGVSSFQANLASGLSARGIQVCTSLEDKPYQAVLLTGVVRDIAGLWRARHAGVRIVQRLDGINWLHRRLRTSPRHFLKAEYGNRFLALLRSRFVDQVVYQSEFARGWWQTSFGSEHVKGFVIHNGVNLMIFTPEGPQTRPREPYRLLLVEGKLQGGYETGLVNAIDLAEQLAKEVPLELMVAGSLAGNIQGEFGKRSRIPIMWVGNIPHDHIPELDRSAHLLFSADLNAACPNSVIEAMACGLPVVAFATGALPELVKGDSGRTSPYGGDPWKLAKPDIPALAQAALEILQDQERFRTAARKHAEEAFGLDLMVDRYLDVLLG